MAYQPITLPMHVPTEVASLIHERVDPFLAEFRFLLTVQVPEQGPKGSLHRPLLILLLAAADGAAQLLHPGKMGIGDKFKAFLKNNCPWKLDPPDGLNIDEACQFLWEEVRCPLFHRYSMRSEANQASSSRMIKFGRIFATDDENLSNLENLSDERPYSDPTFKRNQNKTIIWIDSFYWALRIAIGKSLDTAEKAIAVRDWIQSGEWDQKNMHNLKQRKNK